MKLIRNPEIKGILVLLLIIVILGGALAVTTGKLEQWFGITWGAKALDGIAFVSDRSGSNEIWLMDADGSNPRRVTKGIDVNSIPSVSATGSRILFVGARGEDVRVMSVRPDGSGLEAISSSGSVGIPTFNPNGKQAAYIANGKVYVCGVDGNNPDAVLPTRDEIHQAMTNTLDRSQLPPYVAYAWGSNGESMAGVTRDPTGDEILVFLADLEAKPQMIPARMLVNELIKQSGGDSAIPGGTQVKVKGVTWASEAMVFTAPVVVGDDEACFLATFRIEDGKLQVADFKAVPGVMTGVSLSPDGSRLAFSVAATAKEMPHGILIVNLQDQSGGLAAQGNFMNLVYSPSGDKLLAVQVDPKGNKRDVVTVDTDTGKVTRITKDGHSFSPVWTPVSKQ